MHPTELWQAVLGELELSLSKANFTTWFKHTFILSCTNGEVCIGVPNMFTKAWLEKKYNKDILNSIQTLTNQPIRSVVYRVEIKNAQNQAISAQVSVQTSNEPAVTDGPQHQVYPQNTPEEAQKATTAPASGDLTVNTKYAFNNFIVGKQNELAHAAAQAVAAQPGGVYNPLFIYGGVGLGKTHLLQAIGNELMRRNPHMKALYVTSERFTNDYVSALRTGKMNDFKNRYRMVDTLLIDDIQFLGGKESTQEEFFHTFNQLFQNNKQLVFSSDRPPKAIPSLEARLSSRLEQGMMADVGSPDFETRVAILESKCREKVYQIQHDILNHIASVVQTNVRELEGALNKVIAFHQFKNVRPTLDTVKPILTSFQPSSLKKNVTPKQLIHTVSIYFDIRIEDLLGKSREKKLAFPRQIIMYLMREEMKSSYPSIGNELGGRDHTTAMHAYEKISECLTEDEKLQHDLELIKQRLYTA